MKQILPGQTPKITRHTLDTPYPVGPVHIYTARLDGRLILFDTGPPIQSAIEYHQANMDMDNLEYVFITHFHPDHIGLAKYFAENTNAKIIASRYDTFRYEHPEKVMETTLRIFAEMGFDSGEIERSRKTIEWFEQSAPFAKEYLVLEEQDELCQRLGVRWMRCPGHSQSDIVYILGKAAFTGDVLLREIFQTPLLDVEMETMERRFCNYKAYCGTILKLKTLEGMELYPSHKEYVDSIDERITWYVEKILDRAAAVAPLLEKGASIRDIVIKLFQGEPLKPFTMFIKISEITFLRDFLADPAPLAEAMRQAGLYDKTAEKFKLLA